MANIYTYSAYTDAQMGFNGGFTQFTVPTTAPTLEVHIVDNNNTSLSRPDNGVTAYIYNKASGTYTSSGAASLAVVDRWTVTGGTVTVYAIDVGGTIYNIISSAEQTAFAGQTATFQSVINDSSIAYSSIPSWGESLLGGSGGPNLAGGDSIFGQDGDDILNAGGGADTVSGGTGNDIINGQAGADSLSGGDGNDTIDGGLGNDSITGGAGEDSLFGGVDNDTVLGGDGNDYIDGGFNNDSVSGGAGNDTVLGGENDDTVDGGDGNDTIYGDGTDVRDPNQDVSTFEFDRTNITASGPDGGAGGEAVGESITYNAVAQTAEGIIVDARFTLVAVRDANGNASNMPVDLNNSNLSDPNLVVLNFNSFNTGSPDAIYGGHKAEIIVEFFAASGPNVGQPIALNGTFTFQDLDETDPNNGLETDIERLTVATSEFTSYEIAAPTVTVDGQTGSTVEVQNDTTSFTFSGTVNNNQNTQSAARQELNQVSLDFVARESFTVTLTSRRVNSGFTFQTKNFTLATTVGDASNEGNDSITGGAGDDTIFGSSGNDTIDGGTGNDRIDAGNDSDLILLSDAFGQDTILGAEGGTDNDTLSAINLTTTGVEYIVTQFDNGNLTGTAEQIGTGAVSNFSEIETLVLSNRADIFDSTAVGAITVEGLQGNDSISTGSGNDLIYGGSVNTTATGSSGSGADTIDAGAGDDSVFGGDGADLLIVGLGNDSMRGQVGNDTFRLEDNFGTDTLFGDGGTDVIDASGLTTHGIDVVFTAFGTFGTIGDQTNAVGSFNTVEQFIYSQQGDSVDATAVLIDNRTYDLFGGDDTFTAAGSSGRVTVDGGTGNDSLTGSSDNDSLAGGIGNDTLFGGAGADTLSGGDGQDVITLQESDTATGGLESDLFNFVAGASNSGGAGPILVTGGEDPGDTDIDVLSLAGLTNLAGEQLTKNDITFVGGDPEAGSFTMEDGTVVTFSEIERIICFEAGAGIMTPTGSRPAGQLKVGDLVVTRDHGIQPIRWIGRRTVAARGSFAPIEFAPNRLGNRTALRVSPQHRILVRDSALRLSHGVDEMLIAARHLIDGRFVRQVEGGSIEYVHLMFDRHAIIFAEGLESESFHPGEMGYQALDPAARAELFSLFPELAVSGPQAYGPASRPTLKPWELPSAFARSA